LTKSARVAGLVPPPGGSASHGACDILLRGEEEKEVGDNNCGPGTAVAGWFLAGLELAARRRADALATAPVITEELAGEDDDDDDDEDGAGGGGGGGFGVMGGGRLVEERGFLPNNATGPPPPPTPPPPLTITGALFCGENGLWDWAAPAAAPPPANALPADWLVLPATKVVVPPCRRGEAEACEVPVGEEGGDSKKEVDDLFADTDNRWGEGGPIPLLLLLLPLPLPPLLLPWLLLLLPLLSPTVESQFCSLSFVIQLVRLPIQCESGVRPLRWGDDPRGDNPLPSLFSRGGGGGGVGGGGAEEPPR